MDSSLLKTSLKHQIIQRRQDRGLGDIVVDFSPKPSQPMTAAEIEKESRRRQSNRLSASRSRQKAKEHDETFKQLLEHETTTRELLGKSLKRLENAKQNAWTALRNLGVPESSIQAALHGIDQTRPSTKTVGDRKPDDVLATSTRPCYNGVSNIALNTNHFNTLTSIPTPAPHYEASRDSVVSSRNNYSCNTVTGIVISRTNDNVTANEYSCSANEYSCVANEFSCSANKYSCVANEHSCVANEYSTCVDSNKSSDTTQQFFLTGHKGRCLGENGWADSEEILRDIDLESFSPISPETVAEIFDENLNNNNEHNAVIQEANWHSFINILTKEG